MKSSLRKNFPAYFFLSTSRLWGKFERNKRDKCYSFMSYEEKFASFAPASSSHSCAGFLPLISLSVFECFSFQCRHKSIQNFQHIHSKESWIMRYLRNSSEVFARGSNHVLLSHNFNVSIHFSLSLYHLLYIVINYLFFSLDSSRIKFHFNLSWNLVVVPWKVLSFLFLRSRFALSSFLQSSSIAFLSQHRFIQLEIETVFGCLSSLAIFFVSFHLTHFFCNILFLVTFSHLNQHRRIARFLTVLVAAFVLQMFTSFFSSLSRFPWP
jgi:hypothetical protein